MGTPLESRYEYGPRGPISVRPLDITSESDVQAYLTLVNNPRNFPHFSRLTQMESGELEENVKDSSNHFLLAVDSKGVVVGTMTVTDAGAPQNDHWLRTGAVSPHLQRDGERGDHDPVGFGRQMMEQGIYWAFTHKDFKGRARETLHAAVIMGVDGWERMLTLLTHLGFCEAYMVLPNQIDTDDPAVKLPVTRYYLNRSDFMEMVRSEHEGHGNYYDTIPPDAPFDLTE